MYSRRSRRSLRSPSPYNHRRSRYSSPSPSPYYRNGKYSESLSRTPQSRSGSRSRSCDFSDVANPGNTLYVTGLPSRISNMELKEHFASEGKVVDVHLVVDPYTRESRGFGFVTMASIEEAEKCIKYLDGSVVEGRAMKVEKAKRRRGRTPTPGKYLGPTAAHARSRRSGSSDRERFNFPYYRRSRSPYSRCRYHSPLEYSPSRTVNRRRWKSRSPTSRRRMYRRSYSRSISPRVDRRRKSYSRSVTPRRSYRRSSYRRSYSPTERRRMYRSYSRSISPRRPSPKRGASRLKGSHSRESYSHSRSLSSCSRRSYCKSVSPRKSSRSIYSRHNSPVARRRRRMSHSRSISPRSIRSGRSPSSKKASKRAYSCESYSHSRSLSS